MKKLLPEILDLAFVTVATFAASFTVLRFYINSLALTIIISAIFSALVCLIFRLASKRKNVTYALKKKDAEMLDKVIFTLCIMTDEQLCNFFSTLFKKMDLPFTLDGNELILTQTNTRVCFYFTFSETYAGRVIEFYKQADKGQNIIVLGREFDEKTTALTRRFGNRITLIDSANLYLTLKRYETLPPINDEFIERKKRINLPKSLFSKNKAKKYFLYGVALNFFSFFVFYPIYYVCFGTALIIFSIICFFFGIKDEPKNDNPFRNPS